MLRLADCGHQHGQSVDVTLYRLEALQRIDSFGQQHGQKGQPANAARRQKRRELLDRECRSLQIALQLRGVLFRSRRRRLLDRLSHDLRGNGRQALLPERDLRRFQLGLEHLEHPTCLRVLEEHLEERQRGNPHLLQNVQSLAKVVFGKEGRESFQVSHVVVVSGCLQTDYHVKRCSDAQMGSGKWSFAVDSSTPSGLFRASFSTFSGKLSARMKLSKIIAKVRKYKQILDRGD